MACQLHRSHTHMKLSFTLLRQSPMPDVTLPYLRAMLQAQCGAHKGTEEDCMLFRVAQ